MRRHSRQIALSLAFVSGLVLLLLISSRILVPKAGSGEGRMQDQAANGIFTEPGNTIDVLILGDSESYSSFIPLKLWENSGITSYCCGTPAQKLCYSEEFLKKTYKTQQPKVVILETNAIFRNFSYNDSIVHKANRTFSVFKHHDRWKRLTLADISTPIDYVYTDATKGYRFSKVKNGADTSNYMKKSKKTAIVTDKNRKYLEDIKALCDKNGSTLVLVSVPSTKNWNYSKHNSVDKIAKELDIEYLDLNLMSKDVPIDWERDTRDKGDHLNYFGAEKVTRYIGEYLAKTYELKGHKGEDGFASWDNEVLKFNEGIAL